MTLWTAEAQSVVTGINCHRQKQSRETDLGDGMFCTSVLFKCVRERGRENDLGKRKARGLSQSHLLPMRQGEVNGKRGYLPVQGIMKPADTPILTGWRNKSGYCQSLLCPECAVQLTDMYWLLFFCIQDLHT